MYDQNIFQYSTTILHIVLLHNKTISWQISVKRKTTKNLKILNTIAKNAIERLKKKESFVKKKKLIQYQLFINPNFKYFRHFKLKTLIT